MRRTGTACCRVAAVFIADHQDPAVVAQREVIIRVPRWRVNRGICAGDNGVEIDFEPGDRVTAEQGPTLFEMLIPNAPVRAGNVPGRLFMAPGNEHSILHFGVRAHQDGVTECPLVFATLSVRDDLPALIHRDLPGRQTCCDQQF